MIAATASAAPQSANDVHHGAGSDAQITRSGDTNTSAVVPARSHVRALITREAYEPPEGPARTEPASP